MDVSKTDLRDMETRVTDRIESIGAAITSQLSDLSENVSDLKVDVGRHDERLTALEGWQKHGDTAKQAKRNAVSWRDVTVFGLGITCMWWVFQFMRTLLPIFLGGHP